MRARADLMLALRDLVERKGWTQAAAARRCGVTQPRINDLLRGRISKSSLDALVSMAAAVWREPPAFPRGPLTRRSHCCAYS